MKQLKYFLIALFTSGTCLIAASALPISSIQRTIASSVSQKLQPLKQDKNAYEVFGFAPYWTLDNLKSVDFNTLTTLAYFDVKIDADGSVITDDQGYRSFTSEKATNLFTQAHNNGTRVVLTITQMEKDTIEMFLDDEEAQTRAITETVGLVQKRGIDGINVDFEYISNPGVAYRNKFSRFVARLSTELHARIPEAKLSISVLASSRKEPKLYDLAELSQHVDLVFMMAYDYAVTGADNAMPTSPLYGYKEGKYWYDVSTAVKDFLEVMPANKLVLGVPWYGYDYAVYQPGVKAETRPSYSWRGQPYAATLANAHKTLTSTDKATVKSGWDDIGKVGWKAYYVAATDTWRMIFLEDSRSLGMKYDFAKEKHLAGVGIWALGFEGTNDDMWKLLSEKFGAKLAYERIARKITNIDFE